MLRRDCDPSERPSPRPARPPGGNLSDRRLSPDRMPRPRQWAHRPRSRPRFAKNARAAPSAPTGGADRSRAGPSAWLAAARRAMRRAPRAILVAPRAMLEPPRAMLERPGAMLEAPRAMLEARRAMRIALRARPERAEPLSSSRPESENGPPALLLPPRPPPLRVLRVSPSSRSGSLCALPRTWCPVPAAWCLSLPAALATVPNDQVLSRSGGISGPA